MKNLILLFLLSLLFSSLWAQVPYSQIGKASFYGKEFDGRKTANGEIFSNKKYTAAHKSLPFGTKVKVTNTVNGKWCVVRINDRGPFVKGRIIDLSRMAADSLDYLSSGVCEVKVEEITPENEFDLLKSSYYVAKIFPESWQGKWQGSLNVFNLTGLQSQIKMQLNILQIDSNRYSWTIIYDTVARKYELDISKADSGKYFIDEKNNIIIPSQLMGNSFVSRFEIMGSMLDCIYTLRGKEIEFQIISSLTKPSSTTWGGKYQDEEIPRINSYQIMGYQTAILKKLKE